MESLRNSNVVFGILMAMLTGQLSARPQSEEVVEMKKALYKVCSGKHPITEEMKKSALNGIIPEDREFKCFLKCILDEFSLIDDQGIIDGEALLLLNDSMKGKYEQIVKNCLIDEAGRPDGCETTYNFVACMIKVNPKAVEFLPI